MDYIRPLSAMANEELGLCIWLPNQCTLGMGISKLHYDHHKNYNRVKELKLRTCKKDGERERDDTFRGCDGSMLLTSRLGLASTVILGYMQLPLKLSRSVPDRWVHSQ